MHYRAISSSPRTRARIWNAENLSSEEAEIVQKVSGRAIWNPKEFVAEVYAGLWAKIRYDDDVLDPFNQFGGVRP